jgi:hypothetical protein
MTAQSSTDGLPLLVVTEEKVQLPVTGPTEEGQYVEQGRVTEFVRRVVRRQPVNLETVKGELSQVEQQVETLMKERQDREVGGMRLHGVEVSLGITAEGSIGLVTAGVEVSVTLVYERT